MIDCLPMITSLLNPPPLLNKSPKNIFRLQTVWQNAILRAGENKWTRCMYNYTFSTFFANSNYYPLLLPSYFGVCGDICRGCKQIQQAPGRLALKGEFTPFFKSLSNVKLLKFKVFIKYCVFFQRF